MRPSAEKLVSLSVDVRGGSGLTLDEGVGGVDVEDGDLPYTWRSSHSWRGAVRRSSCPWRWTTFILSRSGSQLPNVNVVTQQPVAHP